MEKISRPMKMMNIGDSAKIILIFFVVSFILLIAFTTRPKDNAFPFENREINNIRLNCKTRGVVKNKDIAKITFLHEERCLEALRYNKPKNKFVECTVTENSENSDKSKNMIIWTCKGKLSRVAERF